jgi:diguanylate cyclase (GGDEF)-like protein
LLYAVILGAETVGRAQESIRERQKLEIYREMAEKDMLTNCYNRNAYNEDIAKITDLEESQILVFDLNNLKKRNDTQGHIAGDKYIVEAADIIYDIFGELGKVYRVGGDEFCVLTKNIPVEVIERDKKRLMKEIIRCRKEEWDDDFGIACGYAKYDAEVDKSIEDTRNRADVEMYYNKKEIKK